MMSFFNLRDKANSNRPAQHTALKNFNNARSFNLGKFDKSELSLWLEINSNTEGDLLSVRVKNEGARSISDLELAVKTSSQLVIVNRGEVFGTSKNKEIIKYLPAKKSVSYSTIIKIFSDTHPAFITVMVNKKGKAGRVESLQSDLFLNPVVSRRSA